jgi:hypothetical protein
MTEETCRRIGAVCGLSLGILLMWSLGFGGLIPGFVFGAGGAVAGGMVGESFGRSKAR